MNVWLAELYDYDYEIPTLVGVYMTKERAEQAIDIVMRQCRLGHPDNKIPEGRWVPFVTSVQIDQFTPAIVDLLGSSEFA